MIFVISNRFGIAFESDDSRVHVLAHLVEVALEMRSQVEIKNVTDDLGVLGIAGPKAGDLLRECIDESGVDWNFLDAKEVRICI